MPEILNTLTSIAAFAGVFLAGWFVATDKNRAELYKRKLDSYEKLFDHIQFIAILTISSKHGTFDENAIINAKMALAQHRMASTLYISKDVQLAIDDFTPENSESEEIFTMIAKIAKPAAKDLQIKNHSFITNLAAGELESLRLQYITKAKNQAQNK